MSSTGVTIGKIPKTNIRLAENQLRTTICLDSSVNLKDTIYEYDFSITAPASVGCGGHDLLTFIHNSVDETLAYSVVGITGDGSPVEIVYLGQPVTGKTQAVDLVSTISNETSACVRTINLNLSFTTDPDLGETYCGFILCFDLPYDICESFCEPFFVKSGVEIVPPHPGLSPTTNGGNNQPPP